MSEIKLPARAAAEEHSQFQIEPSEEEVDFRELASVLWAGKWVIIGIAAVVILIGTFYIFLLPPVYQADGSVQVDDGMAGSGSGSPAGNSAMSSLISGGTVEVDAEIQILQSRMIMTQVATAMNLDISAYPRYFPVIGAAMARHHGAGTLQKPLFGLAKYAWGGEQIQVPTLEVPPSLVDVGLKLTATVDGYRVNGLEGRSLLGKVGEPAELDLPDGHFQIFVRTLVARPDTEFTVARVPINNVIGSLQGSLSVSELGKQSGVIALVATGGSADFVTRFIQTLEDEYVRQNVERRSAEAQQSLVFLRGQLPEAKAKVLVAQHALNVYQRAHGSIDVTGETDAVLSQSVAVESAREQLLQSRDLALQKFTDKHPAIHAIDDQLKLLDQREVQVKQRVAELPETQQQILSLRNDLEVSQQLYTDMLNLIQQLQVTRAGTIGSVRIIDRPLPPLGPSKPHRGELLGGVILLAFVLGCGYVLAMYLLQQGVEDPGELEREFGLVNYASIPFAVEQKDLELDARRTGLQTPLLAASAPDSSTIEAIRSLRTSLYFAMLEAPNNIVMLTGPSPGLGKSFITANLGAVLASAGKRVVVVDADLRRGQLHRYLSTTRSTRQGISEFVSGAAEFEAVVCPTGVSGLSLVARGATVPNPAELLLNSRFAHFMKMLSDNFDYVLLDTPPALAVTDAAIIGALAANSFVVLKSGAHPLREIGEVLMRLKRAGVVVTGAIFNQTSQRAGYYGYGRYTYRYDTYRSN